jgi:hypothetical protein
VIGSFASAVLDMELGPQEESDDALAGTKWPLERASGRLPF